MTTPEDSLWQFSLATYARPGVADACLDLQDRFGADVNLLLFALWAGAVCGVRLGHAELDRLKAEAAAWHHPVVVPLRAVRRHLKGVPGAETLRESIKAAELESERLEQIRLCRASGLHPGTPDPAAAVFNLTRLIPEREAADLLRAAGLLPPSS